MSIIITISISQTFYIYSVVEKNVRHKVFSDNCIDFSNYLSVTQQYICIKVIIKDRVTLQMRRYTIL